MASEAVVTVRLCLPQEVRALRHSVLRPHQQLKDVVLPGDDAAEAAHFCAQSGDGTIVSVASVWPEPPPWRPSADRPWRLRGMATEGAWRGRGAGSAVLAAVVFHVAHASGGLLWCNARLPAVGFYRRAGFVTVGEEWEEPVIGPHVAMFVQVAPVPHGPEAQGLDGSG